MKFYNTELVLTLAAAAFDFGGYTNQLYHKPEHLVKKALGVKDYNVPNLNATEDHVRRAKELRNYFKRLAFDVIGSDNDMERKESTQIYALLQSDMVPERSITRLTYLYNAQIEHKYKHEILKHRARINGLYIDYEQSMIYDRVCEILATIKSKNYEGYLITGLIDEYLVGWYCRDNLPIGMRITINSGTVNSNSDHNHVNIPYSFLKRVKYEIKIT